MKKTISTFIKASLVTAGVMGVVTLNAWWCNHCNRNHRGQVCPITGNMQYGCRPAYGCWEHEVDSDDEDAFIQDMMRRRQARAQKRGEGGIPYGCYECGPGYEPHPFHIVGQTPNGSPVRQYNGSESMYADLNGNSKEVRNIGGFFLFRTNNSRVFSDGKGKLYDSQGNLLPVIGQTSDGYPVYHNLLDDDYENLSGYKFHKKYLVCIWADFVDGCVIQRKKDGQFLRFNFYHTLNGEQVFGVNDSWVDKDGNEVEW